MAVDFSYIAQRRINIMQNENRKLQKKINEIKYISHAKLMLLEYEGLSEADAHKKIERTAMDERKSRIVVAKEIIDRYE